MADGAISPMNRSAAHRKPEDAAFAVIVTPTVSGTGIRPLIEALAGQEGLARNRITVFAAVGERLGAAATAVEALAPGGSLQLHLLGCEQSSTNAAASREVIRAAVYHLSRNAEGSDPALLMLDAEAIPAPDWVACNLRALAAGADLVCGNALPMARSARGRRAADLDAVLRYAQLAVRMEEMLDPVPWDPAPRHRDDSGVSLALRLSRLRLAGGVPDVPVDICRQLLARVRQSGGAVRHCPRSRVFVPPGRLLGAEERRCVTDAELPTPVPDPEHLERSLHHRARLRAVVERRCAGVPRAERRRAVRSQLALATASAEIAPRAVPVEQACAILRSRLEELGDAGRDGAAAARVDSGDERRRNRPSVW